MVVGGGDTAMEEATFLTRYAAKVYVVHRRDKLRASKIMQEKAFKNEKIEFIWNSTVEEILGTPEDGVTGVRLRNLLTGEESVFDCAGVFVAIGHKPNTDLFKGQLDMDDVGYSNVWSLNGDEHSRRLCVRRRAGFGLQAGGDGGGNRLHVGDRRGTFSGPSAGGDADRRQRSRSKANTSRPDHKAIITRRRSHNLESHTSAKINF